MISFDIGDSGQSLQFAADVLHRFDRHRQTRFWHREAGGLLFARFDLPSIDVCEATGPRPTDRRSRYSYRPDEEVEKSEIEANFSRGLHFVGCWHTHPGLSLFTPKDQSLARSLAEIGVVRIDAGIRRVSVQA